MPGFIPKSASAIFATAVLVGVFAGTPAPARAETWTLYTPTPSPTTSTKDMQAAVARIEKETNGELVIRINLGGSLQIQANDITQAVSDNVIQLGDDQFYSGNIPIAGLDRLPGLIRDLNEYDKATPILQPYVDALYAKYNVTILATTHFPKTYFLARNKLTSLADIKGMKVRSFAPEVSEAIKRLGGIPVSLAFAEIAPAMDRGVVDGLITSIPVAYVFRDLIKYEFQMPVNVATSIYLIVNNDAFKKLSPKNQEIVKRVFKEELAGTDKKLRDEEDDLTNKMVTGGMTLTKATPADVASFEGTMSSYWNEWAIQRGPDAVQALKKIRDAIGR